jgi:toxin FitB
LTGFLLDTNVVSTLSPLSGSTNDDFAQWIHAQASRDELFLSVVTIHEISKGIALLKNKGATAKAERLTIWLDTVKFDFSDRILSFDSATATLAGELEAAALSRGLAPGMADAMIAATAKLNALTAVTRNVRHFRMFGIDVLSPTDLSA